MRFANLNMFLLLLPLTMIALVACDDQAEAVGETAVAQITPTILATNTAVPAPTATATPIPPTPTEGLPTLTPTATATEPPATPVALCPGAAVSDLDWVCEEDSRDGIRYCTAVDSEQTLACYEDLAHSFALLLPGDWVTDTTVYRRFTHRPYPPSYQMVKDHQIIIYDENKTHGDGVIIVRVFVPVDRTITSWLIHRQNSNPGQISQTRTNVTVAGHPGEIWLNDCSPQYYREVHVAVHNGERVFWWQHYAYNEASILALRQMLDSLRFGEETAVPAEIPDGIWQEALQGCH
jgi:hypothetical protein